MKPARTEVPTSPAALYFLSGIGIIVGGTWVQYFPFPEDAMRGGPHNPLVWAVLALAGI